jgi:hypothetical protein
MHLTDGQLRAYQDGNLGDVRALEHIAGCTTCQQRAEQIGARAASVEQLLASLAPTDAEAPLPARAAQSRLEKRYLQKEQTMWQKISCSQQRPAWVALTAILVLAVAFSFPGVRAAADSFLGLFRVQQIEAVRVGINLDEMPERMSTYFQLLDQKLGDDVDVQTEGDFREVADAAEASAATGYTVRLPEGVQKPRRIVFQPAGRVTIWIKRQLWQELIDGMGYDYTLPESVDGKTITVSVPDTVTTYYGDCALEEADLEEISEYEQTCIILTQMPIPSIDAPPDVDISKIGQIYLQAFGMSAEDAAAAAEKIDWASTLVIPVPEGGSYAEISVDDVDGIAFKDQRSLQTNYTLMWLRGGMFYAVTGRGVFAEGIEIVNSLE